MRNKKYLKKINEQLILRTAIYITVYMLMGILIRFLAVWIYNMRTWMGTETLYRIVHWLDIRSGMVAALYFAVGAVTILIYYWRKTLSYLQEVVDATDKVYKRDNALIELSEPLKEVENSMNQTKLDIINSENMAREAEQRKNDLVTYLAHDLKTPITSVIGYLTLLKDEPDISPDMRAKYVGIALNKAERLEYLINEFFDITRFNLSKLVLEPERLNLSRMLEQIVS